MEIDPIIAVANVPAASAWYQEVFGFISAHGGLEFDVLKAPDGQVMLCLHRWSAHDHPTMQDPGIVPGNGLILYFRTQRLEAIHHILSKLAYPLAEEIKVNPNTGRREFSVVDPDGYYLTISEHHQF
ncbi:MAG: hypothetical protein KTR24_13755 [Saprospiraceae bacterium]|nr:hypothetical protein [Saprospiraceae bacterium]